jgi:hypothetical protein
VGLHGDQGSKKNPFARVPTHDPRRGSLVIPASDLKALAKSISNIHDTSQSSSDTLYKAKMNPKSPDMPPYFKHVDVIFLLDHLNNLGDQEPIRYSQKPRAAI